MKHFIQLLVLSTIVGVIFLLSGCTDQTTTPETKYISTAGKTEFPTPKGTITGKIHDVCTGMAISGAVLSTGYDGAVHTVTSDASGSFSFADVPAGNYVVLDGSSVWTGTYRITASMVSYNAGQTDPAKRYREYYYRSADITFTSLVPGDSMGVAGLVGDVEFDISALSATVKGSVVNQDMQPAANVLVTLKDATYHSVLVQTRTATDGSFQFANTESGFSYYLEALSSDGSMEGTLTFSIQCNLPQDSLRAQVTTEQIILAPVDNQAPFIISVSVANNEDVTVASGTISIVYTFSEPIKQTPYTQTGLGLGHATISDNIRVVYSGLKKATTALQPLTIGWSVNNTVLTITATGLVGSAKYNVVFDAAVATNLKDLAGNALINNTRLTGDLEGLAFTTAGASPLPKAPNLTRRYVPVAPVNIVPLNFGGGVVGLSWDTSANARSFNIYRKVGNGSYELLKQDVMTLADTNQTPALYTGTAANPYNARSVSYKVAGVSKDLVEGPMSNPLVVTDSVKPQFTYHPAQLAIPGVTNGYVFIVGFDEPLSKTAAESTGNYSFSNFTAPQGIQTYNSATYMGWDGTRYVVYLNVTATAPLTVGFIMTIQNGIVDLTGNVISTTANSWTY